MKNLLFGTTGASTKSFNELRDQIASIDAKVTHMWKEWPALTQQIPEPPPKDRISFVENSTSILFDGKAFAISFPAYKVLRILHDAFPNIVRPDDFKARGYKGNHIAVINTLNKKLGQIITKERGWGCCLTIR